MKTSNVSLQVEKSNHEEILKSTWIGRVLKYMAIIFMLSWPTLLSSCAVSYETPDYEYGVVVPDMTVLECLLIRGTSVGDTNTANGFINTLIGGMITVRIAGWNTMNVNVSSQL